MTIEQKALELVLEWREGPPPKPWSEEWFIALTTYGDRVVLRSLPEEYTYDFTTADSTYLRADKIAKWMQFPDSHYIAPDARAHEADKSRHAAELREQAERFSEAAGKATAHLRKTVFEWGSPMQGEREETIRALSPFILAKPDPLEESLADALCRDDCMVEPAERLRAALEARGLAIVKKEAVNG